MPKWLLVVESHCADPEKEKEFLDWYDKIHFPDILKTKGFVKASRYELQTVTKSGGIKDKFVAMYEIEADDLDDVLKRHSANMKQAEAAGRISKLLETSARAIYRLKHSCPE